MGHGMDVSTLNTYNPTSALLSASSSSLNNSSYSWMSGLSDLKIIQSGAYKKAVKSVYDKDKDAFKESVSNAVSNSAVTSSNRALLDQTSEKDQKSTSDTGNLFDALF